MRWLAASITLWLCVPVVVLGQGVAMDSTFTWEAFTPLQTEHATPVYLDAFHPESYFHHTTASTRVMEEILQRDGFEVEYVREPLANVLDDPRGILVIPALRSRVVELGAGPDAEQVSLPALSIEEALEIARWVQRGGSLLFFSSHYPNASGVAPLLTVFDVKLRDAYAHTKGVSGSTDDELCSWYTLTTAEGHIQAAHPLFDQTPDELEVDIVRWLCGTALIRNPDDVVISLPDSSFALTLDTTGSDVIAAEQSSQYAALLAFPFGKGRVAVSGDQGIFRNMLYTDGDRTEYITINDPNADNAALLVVMARWLARQPHPAP